MKPTTQKSAVNLDIHLKKEDRAVSGMFLGKKPGGFSKINTSFRSYFVIYTIDDHMERFYIDVYPQCVCEKPYINMVNSFLNSRSSSYRSGRINVCPQNGEVSVRVETAIVSHAVTPEDIDDLERLAIHVASSVEKYLDKLCHGIYIDLNDPDLKSEYEKKAEKDLKELQEKFKEIIRRKDSDPSKLVGDEDPDESEKDDLDLEDLFADDEDEDESPESAFLKELLDNIAQDGSDGDENEDKDEDDSLESDFLKRLLSDNEVGEDSEDDEDEDSPVSQFMKRLRGEGFEEDIEFINRLIAEDENDQDNPDGEAESGCDSNADDEKKNDQNNDGPSHETDGETSSANREKSVEVILRTEGRNKYLTAHVLMSQLNIPIFVAKTMVETIPCPILKTASYKKAHELVESLRRVGAETHVKEDNFAV